MDTPQDQPEKVAFARKLMKFGVSLTEYNDAFKQPDFLPPVYFMYTCVT